MVRLVGTAFVVAAFPVAALALSRAFDRTVLTLPVAVAGAMACVLVFGVVLTVSLYERDGTACLVFGAPLAAAFCAAFVGNGNPVMVTATLLASMVALCGCALLASCIARSYSFVRRRILTRR